MKIHLDHLSQSTLIFFDVEYDSDSVVQLAFLILCECEPNIYELRQSINFYVKPNRSLSSFFTHYTNISNDFLCHNGIDLAGAKQLVDSIIFDVDPNKTLIISHGIEADMQILAEGGFNHLVNFPNCYCTYKRAKQLLQRGTRLTLKDVAAEGGYFMFDEHNAYADVWGTLHAFCFLNRLEKDECNL